ncbi:MAG: hypothetical protein IT337_10800 [Thermomicrobiales bacterium]|nr:hypothetical protein [Thermomicrobiales bacterium]
MVLTQAHFTPRERELLALHADSVAYWRAERDALRALLDERKASGGRSYAYRSDLDRQIAIARSAVRDAEDEIDRRLALLEAGR